MSFKPAIYYSSIVSRENFTSPVFFNAIFLQGSEKVLTHTHTHRHLASPNLFLRARGSYANLRRHKGYSHLLCYVFRVLSAIDIRENKERVYPQNPHDFRVANTPIPVNINSRSAGRPHVGTDPVSVRLTSVLRTEAILLVERSERLRIYPGLAPDGCGQQITPRGLSLHVRSIGRIGTDVGQQTTLHPLPR